MATGALRASPLHRGRPRRLLASRRPAGVRPMAHPRRSRLHSSPCEGEPGGCAASCVGRDRPRRHSSGARRLIGATLLREDTERIRSVIQRAVAASLPVAFAAWSQQSLPLTELGPARLESPQSDDEDHREQTKRHRNRVGQPVLLWPRAPPRERSHQTAVGPAPPRSGGGALLDRGPLPAGDDGGIAPSSRISHGPTLQTADRPLPIRRNWAM